MEINNYEDNLKRWRKFLSPLKPSKPYRKKQITEFPGHIDVLCTILGKRLISTQETDMPVKMKKSHASTLKEKIEESKKMSFFGNKRPSRSEERERIVKLCDENVIDLTIDDTDEDYDKGDKFVDVKKIKNITDFQGKTMKYSENSHMEGENSHVGNMTNQDELDNKCIDVEKITQITDFKEKDNTELPSRHYKIDEEKKSSSIASKQYETDKNRKVQTYDICNFVEANQNEDNDFTDVDKRGNDKKEKSKLEDYPFIKRYTHNKKERGHEEEVENSNKRDGIRSVNVVMSTPEDVTDLSESEEELIMDNKCGDKFTKHTTNLSIQNIKESRSKWVEDENNSNKRDGIMSANVAISTLEDTFITDLSESEEELILENKYRDSFTKHTTNLSVQNDREGRSKWKEDENNSNKRDGILCANVVITTPQDTYIPDLSASEGELIMENKFGATITKHTTNLNVQNVKEDGNKWEEDEINSNKRDRINSDTVVISSSEDTYVTDLSESDEELILKCKNGGTVTKNIFSIQNVREPKNKWEEDENDNNKLDGIRSANVVISTAEDTYTTDLSESEEELLLRKYGDTFSKHTENFSNQNIMERRNKWQEDETKSNKNDEVGGVSVVVPMLEDTYKMDFSESEEELLIDKKYRDILTKHAPSFNIQNDRERRKCIPLKSKSDVNKSISQWNLKLFAKYVEFESVRPLEYSCEFKDVDNRVYDEIITNVQKLRKVIDVHSEEDSRIIVNAMVIPLCEEFNLRLETEQTTDCTYLPNCKFDYRLLNHNTVIGCIETKSQGAMNEKALVQAILQLFVIQAEGLNGLKSKESIVEKSLFNILTDGIRFVFMRINGKHLELEYTDFGRQLRVQYANLESEIKTISRSMVSLLMDNLSQT